MNMPYCRFHNTYLALKDCYEHLDDPIEGLDDTFYLDANTVSEDEDEARTKLIELCKLIASESLK